VTSGHGGGVRHVLPLVLALPCGCFPDYGVGTTNAAPIAFVQGKALSLTPSSVGLLAFDRDVTAGDAVVVCFNYDGSSTTVQGVTDSLNNQYKVVVTSAFTRFQQAIAVASGSRGGPDTVHVALSAAPTMTFEVYLHEYSGIAEVDAFDVGSSRNGELQTSSPDDMKSGEATPHANGDLVFGFGVSEGSVSAGTGFETRSSLDQNVTEDMSAALVGPQQATATGAPGSAGGGWSMLMATLRPR
jgi:hypothetical protein